ncbi:MAG: hypothetical protein ABEJ26_04870 [Halosimplex sp.]
MDLDELRSVQSRERQTDSLQQLRESFYRDAGEFIQQLHRERERAAEEADDPWNAPEVNRLSDDIDTAEGTVEAIYERRVGKIVKMASLAAADMPTEDEGLTAEERTLFETLVEAIERNRANVEAVIDGENPAQAVADAGPATDADPQAGSTTDTEAERRREPPADPTSGADPGVPAEEGGDRADVPTGPGALVDDDTPSPPPDGPGASANDAPTPANDSPAGSGVDAADLMGDGSKAEAESGREPGPPAGDDGASEPPRATAGNGGGAPDGEPASSQPDGGDPSVDRATVKITSDVGEIFGVDQRAYDLSPDDVVQLPEANAGPLVERDAAERLD